ncbi:MAG: phage minor head protein [Pseudomonadota bacterium]
MADDRFNFEPVPDARAVAFLEGKGLKRSWRWPSMWQTEHAYAFTLAGVHRLDVLAETKALVTQAIAEGQTLEQFRAALGPKLQSLGFAGPQLVEEFAEGPRKVDLTAPWRTKVIYDTNVRQAYAAAEWQGIVDTAADFPALQYHHTPQQHPRLNHLAWDKIVLPVTHPFWSTNFPPNGWYCKCFTIQVSVDELASGAVKMTSDDQLRGTGYTADRRFWSEYRHTLTGRTDVAPDGVTPGFAYNPGMERRRNLGELLERRIAGLDPDMARAASADLVNFPAFADLVDDAVRIGQSRAAARAKVAAQLAGGSARRDEIHQAAQDAAEAAGVFPADSWPVGVAPAEIRALAPDAGGLVVVNASAIGHSANLHPTEAADWRRVQQLLERGEAFRDEAGVLTLFGTFEEGGRARTWMLALKAVAGAWRVRTLHETSPRRRDKARSRLRPVRRGLL